MISTSVTLGSRLQWSLCDTIFHYCNFGQESAKNLTRICRKFIKNLIRSLRPQILFFPDNAKIMEKWGQRQAFSAFIQQMKTNAYKSLALELFSTSGSCSLISILTRHLASQ